MAFVILPGTHSTLQHRGEKKNLFLVRDNMYVLIISFLTRRPFLDDCVCIFGLFFGLFYALILVCKYKYVSNNSPENVKSGQFLILGRDS